MMKCKKMNISPPHNTVKKNPETTLRLAHQLRDTKLKKKRKKEKRAQRLGDVRTAMVMFNCQKTNARDQKTLYNMKCKKNNKKVNLKTITPTRMDYKKTINHYEAQKTPLNNKKITAIARMLTHQYEQEARYSLPWHGL